MPHSIPVRITVKLKQVEISNGFCYGHMEALKWKDIVNVTMTRSLFNRYVADSRQTGKPHTIVAVGL